MRETVEYYRQLARESWDLMKYQWKAFTVSLLIISALYVASIYMKPGWGTYTIALPAMWVIVITAYARLNAIGPELMGLVWQIRRIGFMLVGIGVISMMGSPFLQSPKYPTWTAVLLVWGLCLTWLSTPGMVPWDWYWTGQYRQPPPPGRPLSPLQRLAGRITREHRIDDLKAALEKAENENDQENEK